MFLLLYKARPALQKILQANNVPYGIIFNGENQQGGTSEDWVAQAEKNIQLYYVTDNFPLPSMVRPLFF